MAKNTKFSEMIIKDVLHNITGNAKGFFFPWGGPALPCLSKLDATKDTYLSIQNKCVACNVKN
jgi:hypothetical protein